MKSTEWLKCVAGSTVLSTTVLDPSGNLTGSRIDGVSVETAASKDRVDAINAWAKAVDEGVAAEANEVLSDHVAAFPAERSAVLPSDSLTGSDEEDTAIPSSSFLSDVHADGQVNGYYCGPATGMGMLKTMFGSGYHSRQDGSLPYQTHMANSSHMQTGRYGATDWSRQQWI